MKRQACFFFQLLSFILPFFTYVSSNEISYSLKLNESEKLFHANGGTTYTLCHNEYEEFNIVSIFHQLSIKVTTYQYLLPWHSVKGISNDDFHTNIETLMYQYFGTEEENLSKIKYTFQKSFQQSFLRDVISSCPSPLFSTNRSQCSMTFSPFGDACIQVKTDQSVDIKVDIEKIFNTKLPFFLLVGFVLLNLSHIFSKSSIFQVNMYQYRCK